MKEGRTSKFVCQVFQTHGNLILINLDTMSNFSPKGLILFIVQINSFIHSENIYWVSTVYRHCLRGWGCSSEWDTKSLSLWTILHRNYIHSCFSGILKPFILWNVVFTSSITIMRFFWTVNPPTGSTDKIQKT